MLSLVMGLLKGVWGYVAAAGAVLLAVLTIFQKGKSAGSNEVIVESAKKEIENVKKAQEVERSVASTPADVKRERLRNKYSRD